MSLQSILEEKIAAVVQRKDDAKRLRKRYAVEMNVKMALFYSQAEQQAALPPEQRLIKLEDICRVAGVQVGQYELSPYLDAIKEEIEIKYPQDILSIIAERKRNATIGSSSASHQSEATPEPALPSATVPDSQHPSSSSAPSSSNPPDNSSALGK